METERAVPYPRLVIDMSIRVQDGVTSSTNERIVGEHRKLSGLHQWRAHDTERDDQSSGV